MANLSYKTRGNSSPQGKARVYFTCHPDDREGAFGLITEAILDLRNCAIWYDSEPEAAFEETELLPQLSQMQLFVVPVTHRLLTTGNRTMDTEFPFAMAAGNHIPVLPILMEPGLDREFESRFGSMQYLDVTSRDVTQKNWREKLKEYLSKILASDELAEQVRKTFDVYLFLSYRKKDRAQAQELMRRIHENEFFRGIGIWYDEYLIPGEDYNESILQALHKSPLFALAVTPNLVSERNYVAEKEYPQAKREHKCVLPFEMLPTDQSRMYEVFAGIDPSIPADDAEAVQKALADALKALAIQPSAGGGPEREYYLGQAYLSGIDVEVNSEFALQFLTSAAEAGYLKAMGTLGDMYEAGNRLPRDSQKARYWKQRQVEELQKWYRESPEEYLTSYIGGLFELETLCIHLGDNAGARKAFEQMDALNEDEAAKKVKGALGRQMMLCMSKFSLTVAEEDFEHAYECTREMAQYCGEGILCEDILDEFAKIPGVKRSSMSSRSEYEMLAVEMMKARAAVLFAEGRMEQATKIFAEALERLESNFVERTEEWKDTFARCLKAQATVYREQGQKEMAVENLLRAKPILQELADEFRTTDYRMEFSDCCVELANLFYEQGEQEKAVRLCAEAAEQLKELILQTYSISVTVSLASTLVMLASLCEKLKQSDLAYENYLCAMQYLLAVSEEIDQTPEAQRKFGQILVLCDKFLLTNDKDGKARNWEKGPGYVNARRALAWGYEQYGDDISADRKRQNEWMTLSVCYSSAQQLFSDLSWETDSSYDRYHGERCHMLWIDHSRIRGKLVLSNYEDIAAECERRMQEDDDYISEYQALLAGLYERISHCQYGMESYEAADASYVKALKLHRKLPKEVQTKEERLAYAKIVLDFANSLNPGKDEESMRAALSFRRECDGIYDEIASRAGENLERTSNSSDVRKNAKANPGAEKTVTSRNKEEAGTHLKKVQRDGLSTDERKTGLSTEEQKPRLRNLYQLMNLAMLQCDWNTAGGYAQKIEGIYTPELLTEEPEAEMHGIFFEAYRVILTCMSLYGTADPAEKQTCYRKMLPLIETKYAVNKTDAEARLFCETCLELAKLLDASAESTERKEKPVESVKLSKESAESVKTLEKSTVSGETMENPAEPAGLYKKALSLAELAQSHEPLDAVLEMAAQAHMGLAAGLLKKDLAEREGRRFHFGKSQTRKEAEAHLLKAVDIWKQLAKNNPDRKEYAEKADETMEMYKRK